MPPAVRGRAALHRARGRDRRGGSRPPRILCLSLVLAVVVGLAPPVPSPAAGAGQAAGAETRERRWLGPDGAPLPFVDDDGVLEFLRQARVISRETLDEGINREEKVLLELDGVRAHAIFRKVDREMRRRRIEGRYYTRFVDHHGGECAAYELARHLGLDSVPPAVPRRLGSTPGSLQIWIEGARDESAEGFSPPLPMAWVRQVWDRILFDLLILNADRNPGNVLAGPDYRLWLYDHGRAFQPQAELLDPEALQRVNRKVWERLQATSDEELKDVVREHLDTEQLNALVARRALLADRVRALVNERGESSVFY